MSDDFGKYLLVVFVAVFGYLAWRAWQVKQASPLWPSVDGVMLVSRPMARNETGNEGGVPTHEWYSDVKFRYSVNGVEYTGDRLRAFGLHHFNKEQAEAELAPFAVGQTVKVYYDPAKPSSSVLIPG